MDTQDELKKKFQTQIDQLGRQLDDLRGKATRAAAEAGEDFGEAMDSLEQKRDALLARLKAMKDEGVLDEMKEEAEELLDEVKQGISRFLDRFKKPDEPS